MNSGLCRRESPSFRKTARLQKTRSNPPTSNLFKCNSNAIRREKSQSKALKCVRNGRAAAPPETDCSMGVDFKKITTPEKLANFTNDPTACLKPLGTLHLQLSQDIADGKSVRCRSVHAIFQAKGAEPWIQDGILWHGR